MSDQTRLLFVCLGNICRSPMAEGIFLHLANEKGLSDRFIVDSAGTGAWHVGKRPDSRALATANRFGIELPSVARQVSPSDFEAFDLILAMDRSNRADLEDLGVTNVRLMRSFDATLTGEYDVPDPYYGDGDGFVKVYEMLTRACDGLIEHLTRD
ncbi:MAG: low molecular weight phosphotyrosine protein phosphatase [Phycisphaerales bacterium]|nr:low molecular weight phosphotyrosine protein phosphatase [Phycisphaerales bacterium]